MVEQAKSKSVSDLLSFLDYVGSKGLMKPATIGSWKAACKQVFGILEADEGNNIDEIDLEGVFTRFENKNSQDFTPNSLQTYKSRVKKAISEFLSFKRNPSNWKPSLPQRPARQIKSKSFPGNSDDSEIEDSDPNEQNIGAIEKNKDMMTHRFPLRDGITINISGVPRDLKLIEAKRIGAFLSTLCEDFKIGEF
jgi:hypothetical protein